MEGIIHTRLFTQRSTKKSKSEVKNVITSLCTFFGSHLQRCVQAWSLLHQKFSLQHSTTRMIPPGKSWIPKYYTFLRFSWTGLWPNLPGPWLCQKKVWPRWFLRSLPTWDSTTLWTPIAAPTPPTVTQNLISTTDLLAVNTTGNCFGRNIANYDLQRFLPCNQCHLSSCSAHMHSDYSI